MNTINFDPRAFRRYEMRQIILNGRIAAEYRPVPFSIAYASEIRLFNWTFAGIMALAFLVGVV